MRINNFLEYMASALDGDPPQILWGTTVPDGDAGIWLDAPLGSLYVRQAANNVTLYQKTAHVPEDADWDAIDFLVANAVGFVPIPLSSGLETASNAIVGPLKTSVTKRIGIPLTSVREVGSNNFLNIAGNGGVLATDTTPIIQYTNGDTDSAIRLNWAGGNSDPIAFQFLLPEDYAEGSDMTVNFYGASAGASNSPTMSVDTFFDVGDTKVTDVSAALTNTLAVRTATIAASDIPAGATVVNMEVTPAAHATDALYLYGIYVTYATEASPSLTTTNGDTDSALVLTWGAGDVTPVVFQTPLPPDLDDGEDVTVHFRVKSSGANDTPTLALDSYFNEGDTKVEDATAAITSSWSEKIATIAAADVPSGAQTLTFEVTPGAHNTDSVLVSAVWAEYVRT